MEIKYTVYVSAKTEIKRLRLSVFEQCFVSFFTAIYNWSYSQQNNFNAPCTVHICFIVCV